MTSFQGQSRSAPKPRCLHPEGCMQSGGTHWCSSVSATSQTHIQQTSVAPSSVVTMATLSTTWTLVIQERLRKQRVGVTQRPCPGLDGRWQVAGAAAGAGAKCAPALGMPTAPPSSEVSASTGENHTPTSPPPLPSSPHPILASSRPHPSSCLPAAKEKPSMSLSCVLAAEVFPVTG